MAIDDSYIPVAGDGARAWHLPIVHKIEEELVHFLRTMRPEAARVCVETLLEIAKNPNIMANARVSAASRLGEFAGVLGVKGVAGVTRDPEHMSTSELHSQVEALERALADRARIVPNQADHLTQLVDLA
jgi:hypothetical protein